jgi:hypothetical protein
VEYAVRAVGQAFTQLRGPDVRKDAFGAIDFCVSYQFRCYRKEDPPSRVKPVPIITIIFFIVQQAFKSSSTHDHHAIDDLISIAFYFLFHPGNYTGTTSDDTLFCVADVELHVDDRAIDPILCSDTNLHDTTLISLTFTTQKNGTKGEVITHGPITDDLACPVKSIVGHIIHLCQHKAANTTHLVSYFHNGKLTAIKATDVTRDLCMSTIATAHQTGIT